MADAPILTPDVIEKLERLAQAAQPGPWAMDTTRHHAQNQMIESADVVATDYGHNVASLHITAWKPGRRDARPTAAFIAVCDPQTVLALVAKARECEALRAQLLRLEEENQKVTAEIARLEAEDTDWKHYVMRAIHKGNLYRDGLENDPRAAVEAIVFADDKEWHAARRRAEKKAKADAG